MQFYRRNRITLAVILAVLGGAWLAVSAFLRRYRSNHAADADELRSRQALQTRSSLQEKVRNVPADKLAQLATGEVADYLCDRWKLPAGTTPEEVAGKAYDPELSEVLQECANLSYLPGSISGNVLKDAERTRRILLKAIKILLLATGLMLQFDLAAAEAPQDWNSALKSYDRGDYKSAQKYFEKYLSENPGDPNVYYNLGCIAEANDQPEMALYYLECAGLADPLDSAIHENRNVMRRKFFLPDLSKNDDPASLIKSIYSRLHPEDYLVLAGLMIFIFCVIASLRTPLKDAWRWGIAAAAAGCAVLFLLLAVTVYHDSYRGSQALIVSKNADLYSFPSASSRKNGSLAGGTPVTVLEERSDHTLVRSGENEGWVENKSVKQLAEK